MISIVKNMLPVLQFASFNGFSELFHFSTTRIGGCSSDNYSSLNLGFNSGDLPENVTTNQISLCKSLEIKSDWLVFPKQTHTANVKTITSRFFELDNEGQRKFLNETDAVITELKNVCIAVKTADCVPILLFDTKRKVVASVHAGWRGTVQNIVSVTIHKMTEEFGTEPTDLFAGIGPSISPDVYEVGEEVWKQFNLKFYKAISPAKPDKRLLDLWSANYHQLIMAGVPAHQIEVAGICTLSDPERFFSARRDGLKTGRMATGIMLR